MGTARVKGQRDIALNSLPFRGIAVNDADANTASVQVYASDSGILFINEYASTTTYTLPVVADCAGKIFFFYSNVAAAIIILGGTEDVMSGGTTSAVVDADKVTSSAAIGNWGVITSDGVSYQFLAGTGTWTASG